MTLAEIIRAEEQDLPFEVRILFQSEDLLVRQVARGSGALCYVTFDSYTDNRSLERPGFGEEFFLSRGIDAIHVLSRDNYWYQHPELPEALAAAAAATHGYDRVLSYGSSMGGFAALHYGAACGAHCGIAISPQFSVDPDVAPFEDRWLFDASRIKFRSDKSRPLAQQYIFYDPYDSRDREHFALFSALSPTVGLKAPFAGHPVGSYLHETGMFTPFFAAVQLGELDADTYQHELRARRRQSGQYFFALSRRIPFCRPKQRIALSRQAVAVQPANGIYVSNLAWQLDAAGEFEEAATLHARAIELMPGNLHILHLWAWHLERTGEIAAARAAIDDLITRFPDVYTFRNMRRRLIRTERRTHWYGKVLRLLHLEDLVDYGREYLSGDKLIPNAKFRRLMSTKTIGSDSSSSDSSSSSSS